jgi:hypothetical protein
MLLFFLLDLAGAVFRLAFLAESLLFFGSGFLLLQCTWWAKKESYWTGL